MKYLVYLFLFMGLVSCQDENIKVLKIDTEIWPSEISVKLNGDSFDYSETFTFYLDSVQTQGVWYDSVYDVAFEKVNSSFFVKDGDIICCEYSGPMSEDTTTFNFSIFTLYLDDVCISQTYNYQDFPVEITI